MRQVDVPSGRGGAWKAWACIETARFPFAVAAILVAGQLVQGEAAAPKEQSANEIATMTSIALGSARECGVDPARIETAKLAVVKRLTKKIEAEVDRQRMLRFLDQMIEISANTQKETQTPCTNATENLEMLERWLGTR